jgi:hypothetical protein
MLHVAEVSGGGGDAHNPSMYRQGVALSPENICTESSRPWGKTRSEGHSSYSFTLITNLLT